MIIVMNRQAQQEQIDRVLEKLAKFGFSVHLSQGVERTIVGAIGDKTRLTQMNLETLPGVEKVVPILQQYKLAGREFKQENTVFRVGDVVFGDSQIPIMAGPCAVESREQLLETAHLVKAAGARILRGGAFKPRTSPYAFQGLEAEGLKMMAEAREQTGLLIITEVVDPRDVELVAQYSDIIQIGARNMQNFLLLKEVAKTNLPVLLKRGLSATVEEWLMAAEYLMAGGNYRVILCERGIRTFETGTRNTLDLSAVALAKQLSHLPVVVDPSHATGVRQLVAPMAKAAIAAGADGLIIEVHPKPEEALCDGPQSLTPDSFQALMQDLSRLAELFDRTL